MLGGLLLVLLVLNSFTHRLARLHTLENKRDNLAAAVTQQAQTQAALQTAIAQNQSDQAVDDWAHEQGWTLPGEYPVVPLSNGTPAATAAQPVTATAAPAAVPNWQTWWALFFNDH